MKKCIVLMIMFMSFMASGALQASLPQQGSQSDHLVLSIKYLQSAANSRSQSKNVVASLHNDVNDSRSQSRNEDPEVRGLCSSVSGEYFVSTIGSRSSVQSPLTSIPQSRSYSSVQSLMTSGSPSRNCSSLPSPFALEEYRNSPMVKAALGSIALDSSFKTSSALADKVIRHSPSPMIAGLIAEEMILTAKSNSPFVKKCHAVLADGRLKADVKESYQQSLQVVKILPCIKTKEVIYNRQEEIKALQGLNDFHKNANLFSDKRLQLNAFKGMTKFVNACEQAREARDN